MLHLLSLTSRSTTIVTLALILSITKEGRNEIKQNKNKCIAILFNHWP